MHRFLGILTLGSLLLIPLSSYALEKSPSALLPQLTFKGNPHAFSTEVHGHIHDAHVGVWVKGSMEGSTLASLKARWNATMDIAEGSTWARVKTTGMLHQGILYFRVTDIQGDIDPAYRQELMDQSWIHLEIPEPEGTSPALESIIAEILSSQGTHTDEQEVHALLQQVIDALFSLEGTRFVGGNAYSLKLAPNALERVLHVLQQSPIADAMEIPASVGPYDTLPINVHVRMNTNTASELLFVKWYASTGMEGWNFVLQGESTWVPFHVNVEIPQKSVAFDALQEKLGTLLPSSLLTPSLPYETPEDSWNEQSVEWEYVEVPEPVEVLPPETPPSPETCTEVPGTPEYLHQARKGLCRLPRRDSYRINNLSSGKVLNPRTTRLKDPSIPYWRDQLR